MRNLKGCKRCKECKCNNKDEVLYCLRYLHEEVTITFTMTPLDEIEKENKKIIEKQIKSKILELFVQKIQNRE